MIYEGFYSYNKVREPKFGTLAEHLEKKICLKSHSDISILFSDMIFGSWMTSKHSISKSNRDI
jgi:hypothetical protein